VQKDTYQAISTGIIGLLNVNANMAKVNLMMNANNVITVVSSVMDPMRINAIPVLKQDN